MKAFLLLLLFLLFVHGTPASDCPRDCSCYAPDSIFCYQRRSPTMPQGMPASTRSLYLFSNGIEILARDDFEGLAALELVDLSQNKLTELPDRVFQPLSSLRNLDLSSNQIERVAEESFRGLALLERLYLYGNHIRTVHPAAFDGLDQLLELKLQGNRLTTLPALAMPRLLLLDLCYNALPSPGTTDLRTPNLESLKLAGMGLTGLDAELMASLGNLHDLDVSNNELDAFPPALREARGLIHLSLAGNPMGALRPEDFRNLGELQELDVSAMSLQALPEGFPQLFPHLKRLAVAENPFNCLCSLAWFPAWLRGKAVALSRTEETRCHFPPLVAGKVLERLERREFGCPAATAVTRGGGGAGTTAAAPPVTTLSATVAPAPKPSEGPYAAEGDEDGEEEEDGGEEEDGSPPPAAPASPSSDGGAAGPEAEPRLCPSHACLHGGTCRLDPRGQLECTCPRGTSGAYCEVRHDPPLPPPPPEDEGEGGDEDDTAPAPAGDAPDISSRLVTSTSILLDLRRYIEARPYIRGVRLTYRNLSGPDRRPLQLSVPASYPEYTLRGLRPNCTYAVCASPLGEPTGADSVCTEARTAGPQHATTAGGAGARVEDRRLTTMLAPALAVLLLLALAAGAAATACYLRRRRRRARGHLELDRQPSQLELEGVGAGAEEDDGGALPRKRKEMAAAPEPAVQNGGLEYEVLLLQEHCAVNNNVASHKPSYF